MTSETRYLVTYFEWNYDSKFEVQEIPPGWEPFAYDAETKCILCRKLVAVTTEDDKEWFTVVICLDRIKICW